MARDPLQSFDAFVAGVRARLDAGRAAYGDRSFERPSVELLAELQQEALDLAGWGFVLWERLDALHATAMAVDAGVIAKVVILPEEQRPPEPTGDDHARREQCFADAFDDFMVALNQAARGDVSSAGPPSSLEAQALRAAAHSFITYVRVRSSRQETTPAPNLIVRP